MAETTKAKVAKPKKMADPIAASIDPATQEMIVRAQKLNIDTVSWEPGAAAPAGSYFEMSKFPRRTSSAGCTKGLWFFIR